MARHAIAADDKQARRQVILAAASALFVAGDGSLPAAAQIAAAAGLAKGTVYLYFHTKEEIFAALLLDGWTVLLGEVEAAFKGARGRRAGKVAAFLGMYVGHFDRHPELLRLDALGYGVLDKNLDAAKLREFKLGFVARLTQAGLVVEHVLRLSPGQGTRLLMRTYALTRGLWQSNHPYQKPMSAEAEPALAALHPDFDEELMQALTEYWRGALAT